MKKVLLGTFLALTMVTTSSTSEAHSRRARNATVGAAVTLGIIGAIAAGIAVSESRRECYWTKKRVYDEFLEAWVVKTVKVCE